jgi:hypothetical protein
VAVAALVVAVLGESGVLPARPELVELVAPPPLDLVGDLRVVLARASVVWLAPGIAAAVVVRSALLASCRRDARALGGAVRTVLAALVPALVAAGLTDAGEALRYAAFVWAGAGMAAALVLACGRAGWVPSRSFRAAMHRAWRDGARLPTMLGILAGDAALARGAASAGRTGALAAVAGAAALRVLGSRRLARPGPDPPYARAASLGLLAAACGAGLLLFELPGVEWSVPRKHEVHASFGLARGTLLLVGGLDSSARAGVLKGSLGGFHAVLAGFPCGAVEAFGYPQVAGVDAVGLGPRTGEHRSSRAPVRTSALGAVARSAPSGRRPRVGRDAAASTECAIRALRPYRTIDTEEASLGRLAVALAKQASSLRGPLAVVGDSTGDLVVLAAFRALRSRLDAVVLVAPIGPGPGLPSGLGAPGAGELLAARELLALGHGLGVVVPGLGHRLVAEVLRHPGTVARLWRTSTHGVPVMVLEPVVDWPVDDDLPTVAGRMLACRLAASHGGIGSSPQAAAVIGAFLRHGRAARCDLAGTLRAGVVEAAASLFASDEAAASPQGSGPADRRSSLGVSRDQAAVHRRATDSIRRGPPGARPQRPGRPGEPATASRSARGTPTWRARTGTRRRSRCQCLPGSCRQTRSP